MTRVRRSDAERNRVAVLVAADQLFSSSGAPARVSMDDVAAAAGVGKGTLFRAFGSRAGLIQALWEHRSETLRRAIVSGPPPLGPGTDARRRISALMAALLDFKLDNRHLVLTAEERSATTSLYEQSQYQAVHRLLRELLAEVGHVEECGLLAHVLLGGVRADLVDHLTSHERISRRQLHSGVASITSLILGDAVGAGTRSTCSSTRTT